MTTAPTVEVWFDLSHEGGDFFTLDDSEKGKLDDTTFLLAGALATDISSDNYRVVIQRGRSRLLDSIAAGTARISLRNHERRFDPRPFASGSPFADNVVPGKRVRVSAEGVSLFDGTVEDWDYRWQVDAAAAASILAVDALGELARKRFGDWSPDGGQTAGERLHDVLDRDEVRWGPNRDIDPGVSALQADTVSSGTSVLNYAQQVAQSDFGRLFASRAGIVTFRDRHDVVNPSPSITFGRELSDDPDPVPVDVGVRFHGVQVRFGSELLFNDVVAERVGGTPQRSANEQSIAAYGRRTLVVGSLLLESDTQAAGMAAYLESLYSEPQAAISELRIIMDSLPPAQRAEAAALDISDTVTVGWRPAGQGPWLEQVLVVDGVGHEFSTESPWVMTLQLGDVDERSFVVLDDDVFGELDANRLAF